MTTTTGTMTPGQAEALRGARHMEARILSRHPRHVLVAIYQSEGGLGGGTWSKDDLISSVLEKRYPVARYNEAGHILHHDGGGFSACEFCQCQETWTAPSVLAPGCEQLVQCALAPGHNGNHRPQRQASVGAE